MLHGTTFVDGGYRPAIAKVGTKWTQIVFLDGSRVRVKRTRDRVAFRPIEKYNLSKLARKFLRIRTGLGTKKEFTKAAKAILLEAKG